MDRAYLAKLIQKISRLSPKVIGIDFSLKDSTSKDSILIKTIEKIIKEERVWLVLGVDKNADEEDISIISKIASPQWSLQGAIYFTDGFVELPDNSICSPICPFSYWLALAHTTEKKSTSSLLLQSQFSIALKDQLIAHRDQEAMKGSDFTFLKHSQVPLSSKFSQANFGTLPYIDQRWLHPIIDFSIPPAPVYKSLPAWKVLETSRYDIPNIESKIIIIAPSFPEAGITPGEDSFTPPDAFIYWWKEKMGKVFPESWKMTGGEVHAYMVHHLLSKHLVVPIPDLWMIGVAAILGKGTLIFITSRFGFQLPPKRLYWAIFSPVIYGVIGFQVYLSGAVLLPWLFPSIVFWLYLTPTLRRIFHE